MKTLFGLAKKFDLQLLMEWCFLAFVFCIPLQIHLLTFQATSYQSGLFNPFVSFYLYIGDLFLFLATLLFGIQLFRQKIVTRSLSSRQKFLNFLLLCLLIAVEISFAFAGDKVTSFWFLLRFLEFFLFYLLYQWGIVDFTKIKKVFLWTVFLQACLAIFQYVEQGSLGLGFLGEPLLKADLPGLAKIHYGEQTIVRPYGTFVHPNVLSAYVLVAFFFCLFLWKKKPTLYGVLSLVLLISLVLCFSRGAWLALAFSLLFYFSATNKKVPILYFVLGLSALLLVIVLFNLASPLQDFIFNRAGVLERLSLLEVGKNVLIAHPFGIGVANFTLYMQDFVSYKIAPWDLQPVHNLFLLLAVEGGFLLLGVFIYLFVQIFRDVYDLYSKFKRRVFAGLVLSLWACLLVLSLFDHYLWTLYQGQFLFWFFLLTVSHYLEVESTSTQIEHLSDTP